MQLYDLAAKQLGTVGAGNHYVDLFEDATERTLGLRIDLVVGLEVVAAGAAAVVRSRHGHVRVLGGCRIEAHSMTG